MFAWLPSNLLAVLLSLSGYIVHGNTPVLVHGGEPVFAWFKLNTSVFPFQVSFDVGKLLSGVITEVTLVNLRAFVIRRLLLGGRDLLDWIHLRLPLIDERHQEESLKSLQKGKIEVDGFKCDDLLVPGQAHDDLHLVSGLLSSA